MNALRDWDVASRVMPSSEVSRLREDESIIWRDDVSSLTISSLADDIGAFRLRQDDALLVDVSPKIKKVTATRSSDTPVHTLEHFVRDQVLPRALSHKGKLVLHAATVDVEDGAILILGDSGHGKSTLGASLHARPFSLLGDDAAVLSFEDDQFSVKPFSRSLRLLPDSLRALFPKDMKSEEVAHYSSKRSVRLADPREQSEWLPLRSCFLLGQPRDDQILIARTGGGDACVEVLRKAFCLDPTDMIEASRRMTIASRLVRSVPIFSLTYPRNYSDLPTVRSAIVATLNLNAGGSGTIR